MLARRPVPACGEGDRHLPEALRRQWCPIGVRGRSEQADSHERVAELLLRQRPGRGSVCGMPSGVKSPQAGVRDTPVWPVAACSGGVLRALQRIGDEAEAAALAVAPPN
jgi:hypothetical protein